MPLLEIIGISCTLAGIYLASRGKTMAWPLQTIASVVYAWLFFAVHLFGEAVLQLCYTGLALYGWWQWSPSRRLNFTVSHLSLKQVIVLNTAGLICTVLVAQGQVHFLPTDVPYLDSLIFIFGLLAQWMQATRKIENWLYWIALDLVAAWVYYTKGLYLTAGLYLILTLLALYGWVTWHRHPHRLSKSAS